jgi:murein DD-endopeptidase MepM/ murein hydrolase activator NlpD
MHRIVLGIWILVVTTSAAFYFGRHSAPGPAEVRTPVVQSRARVRESIPQPAPTVLDAPELMDRKLTLPIEGLRAEDIQDTFDQSRDGTRRHEATDILAPFGTPVLAMDDGVIQKLFLSKAGGVTIYQFDNTGKYSYYYAHLNGYVAGLKEGMHVKRGDRIGYVGSTGNADPKTPHLHVAVFLLGPDKKWWEGTPINPYPILIKTLRDR